MQQPLSIDCEGHGTVPAILDRPEAARAAFVFAHGAGAAMDHSFMAEAATGLASRGIATLRFNFPFITRGTKRPDPAPVAQAVVRSAVRAMERHAPELPLFAGGKSFGGRMTSQAQAERPLPHVRGLVFFGFPLHAAGKPAGARGAHLAKIRIPLLFLQGTRDALADLGLLTSVVGALDGSVALSTFEDADHSFHVRARSGGNDAATRDAMLDRAREWIDRVIEAAPSRR